MDKHRFDTITKALATGATRRDTLRGLAAGLVGAALAAVIPRQVGAQQGEQACAAFCQSLPPGPQRGRCVAECGTGQGGLFDACDGDLGGVCTDADGTISCPSFSSDPDNCGGCAEAGTGATAGDICPAGDICSGGACTCTQGGGAYPPCGADSACCACGSTTEGLACVDYSCTPFMCAA